MQILLIKSYEPSPRLTNSLQRCAYHLQYRLLKEPSLVEVYHPSLKHTHLLFPELFCAHSIQQQPLLQARLMHSLSMLLKGMHHLEHSPSDVAFCSFTLSSFHPTVSIGSIPISGNVAVRQPLATFEHGMYLGSLDNVSGRVQ
mmetsp:Transcript_3502/g.7691  ORF Transcript_3502/g.7691 Transcript_3502/m.7691 type:complete len:143 (-) Transcript_3502:918-1346(-)